MNRPAALPTFRAKFVAPFILSLALGCASSQPKELPQTAPAPLAYLGEWGTKGDGPGQLSAPKRMAVDSLGNVYIADGGSGFVHKFDGEGHPLLSFKDDHLKQPAGIAVDRRGAMYVSDYARGLLLIFFPDGTRYREIRGGPGRRFRHPVSICVDDDGNIFVLDGEGTRIQEFRPDGRFVRAWGKKGTGPGEFDGASDAALAADGFLYLAEAQNHRVLKYSREGQLAATWEIPATSASRGQVPLSSAIASSDKYIFIADSGGRVLDVWTMTGEHRLDEDLDHWVAPAPLEIEGMAVSPHGELLVLDRVAGRVLRFHINF